MANRLYDLVNSLFRSFKRDTIHTQIECRVVKVNHEEGTVDVLPLVKTKYRDGTQIATKEIFDVPLFTYSAEGGLAAVRVPVAIGDTVVVHFSERDNGHLRGTTGERPVNAVTTETHGYFPAYAVPSIYTLSGKNIIPRDELVIQYGLAKITLKKTGEIEITGSLTNNDVNIGETHTHDGVQTGTGVTSIVTREELL